MKKLLLVLLVVALASFLFVGCLPTTPAEGEGEGEGEGETGVVVEIAGSIVLDGKTYVKSGTRDVTITFPAPVAGAVTAVIGYCSGDYSKDLIDDLLMLEGFSVVLFPNADRTIWTGSGDFGIDWHDDCCASYVMVSSGECADEVCIKFPVIIDSGKPYAKVAVTADVCSCEGIALTFTSGSVASDCADATECCGDECSGLASWAIDIYSGDPFDLCCDTPCKSPVYSCSGTGCAITCVTDCLPQDGMTGYTADGYYVLTTLLDELGNKTRYYVNLEPFDLDFVAAVTAANAASKSLAVELTEYAQDKVPSGSSSTYGVCSWWCRPINAEYDTGEYGFCVDSPQNVIEAEDDCELIG